MLGDPKNVFGYRRNGTLVSTHSLKVGSCGRFRCARTEQIISSGGQSHEMSTPTKPTFGPCNNSEEAPAAHGVTNYAASPCNMILSVAAQLCHEHLLSTRLPGHGAVARVSWRSAVAGKAPWCPWRLGTSTTW